MVPNGIETLQKISTGWVRTNVTDDRQQRTFAKPISHLFARGHILSMRASRPSPTACISIELCICAHANYSWLPINNEGIEMTKCELETEFIMRNANLLWYQLIQLLTQSQPFVLKRAKHMVGQLNCIRGWWGNSPPLYMVKMPWYYTTDSPGIIRSPIDFAMPDHPLFGSLCMRRFSLHSHARFSLRKCRLTPRSLWRLRR